MAKYLYILILLFSFTNVWGNPKYEKIDRDSKSVPDSLKTTDEIAEYLTSKLNSEDEKIRALYIWITHNIKYNLSQINSEFQYSSYDKMVEETIKTRKGVCGHYAQLFHSMCKSIGIESFVIAGYTRQLDSYEISELDHAWNAVKINGNYLFVDNTLAAGFLDYKGNYIHEFSDDYFLIPPKAFIKTHVPFDPIWQFLDNPISNVDFKNKDFSKLSKVGNFAYKDSISTIEKMDILTQIKKKIERIKKSGITHRLIQKEIKEDEELVENLKYNKWISNFNDINKRVNEARDEINMGINFDNTFIGYTNKRFRNPKIEDSQIENTIEKANLHFYQGKNQLKKSKQLLYGLEYSGQNIENLKLTEKHKKGLIDFIIQLEYKILEVEPSIIKDTDYAKRYLKKWKPLRDMVPY
ncbi:transglutaminase domain-containing protein [Maribacter sp. MAR_2009_72]|uniref:transglutaminase domain-containing protein n=1 Tax=Maribacter sp. MAR_2009_72 TaxID=1250050 RepID=UPI001198E092|nr:transglutaminase domain-containing protein [Maribacter sp. MAR_2009_72]TVZ15431.1 transglutaminase superfamily protein [Maribacter sp. MAR_2009_72]